MRVPSLTDITDDISVTLQVHVCGSANKLAHYFTWEAPQTLLEWMNVGLNVWYLVRW